LIDKLISSLISMKTASARHQGLKPYVYKLWYLFAANSHPSTILSKPHL